MKGKIINKIVLGWVLIILGIVIFGGAAFYGYNEAYNLKTSSDLMFFLFVFILLCIVALMLMFIGGTLIKTYENILRLHQEIDLYKKNFDTNVIDESTSIKKDIKNENNEELEKEKAIISLVNTLAAIDNNDDIGMKD